MPATEPRPIGFKSPWRYRALTYRIVIGVVAVVLVAGLDAWWIGTRPPQADAGDVVHLGAAVADGLPERDLPRLDRVPVITPAAPVELTLGEPVDELASGLRDADGVTYPDPDPDAQGYLAPRGESFVPIRWRPGSTPPAPSPVEDRSAPQAEDLPAPTLSVAVDDEVVYGPVALEGSDEEDAIAVAVPDTADVEVRVTFDGATQTVDARTGDRDAGVAQAYYDVSRYGGPFVSTCGFRGGPSADTRYQAGCDLKQAAVAPWRPGPGWVDEPGQTWAGVSYRWVFPLASRPDLSGSKVYYPGRGRLGGPRLEDGTRPDTVTKAPHPRDVAGSIQYAGWLLDEMPKRFVVVAPAEATYRRGFSGEPPIDVRPLFKITLHTGG